MAPVKTSLEMGKEAVRNTVTAYTGNPTAGEQAAADLELAEKIRAAEPSKQHTGPIAHHILAGDSGIADLVRKLQTEGKSYPEIHTALDELGKTS